MWALSIYTINLIFVNQIFQTSEGQQNWSEAVSLLLSKFLIFFTYQVNHNYLSQTPKPNYEARINRTGIQSGLSIINNFKSNYSGIKSRCGLHIIRPHLEKRNCENSKNWLNFIDWQSYRNFLFALQKFQEFWKYFSSNLM